MKTLIHWITRKTFFCSYCCGVCGLRFSLVMSVLSEDYLSIMPVPEFIWDVYHCSQCSHGSMQGHGKEPQFPWPWTLLASIRAAGAAPSAVQLQCPAQLLHCCSSIGTDACFSLRVGYHSGTVNFCWFLLEWQGGMYHLSQTLYQSCGPPSSLEFMRSCRGRKCVMDVFVHCAALAASLFLWHLVHQALVILYCWDTQPVPCLRNLGCLRQLKGSRDWRPWLLEHDYKFMSNSLCPSVHQKEHPGFTVMCLWSVDCCLLPESETESPDV